jgi:hypothetical protein
VHKVWEIYTNLLILEKNGRNKSLFCHLAKHSLTSNTLNIECVKKTGN